MTLPADLHMWFSFAVIGLAILSYASEKISMEVTSVAVIAVLLVFFFFFPVMGDNSTIQINTEMILLGFSNPALITVLLLLVLGQAIIQTGALNEVANLILKATGQRAVLSIGIALVFVMLISGFLNNTPVVVIFIPIIGALAKAVGLSPSKVMIPLSFVSILGGMVTLIGSSTNLLVSGIMTELEYPALNFFDFSVPGLILAGVGMVYVFLIVPRLLPNRASMVSSFADDENARQFISQIDVDYRSELIGKALEDGALPDFPEISVRMIQRGEHAYLPPFESDLVIRPQDTIVVSSTKEELAAFYADNPDALEHHLIGLGIADEEGEISQSDMSMAEIVVSPSSNIVGQNLEQIGFRHVFSSVVLGIQRQSKVIRTRVSELRLAPGDVLLVMGPYENLLRLHESRDFLLLEWSAEDIHSGKNSALVAAIFTAVVAASALDVLPIVISAFLGVSAVLLTRCINIRQAVRAVDSKIVLLIAASLAMGAALQATGGASFLANNMIGLMNGASPLVIMSALFILMALLTNVLSNNAAAVLFTPIAINLADKLEVDPRMFIFAVIFACNCSFATPIGYQTNLMVMGPGHYKFADFIRSGVPLVIIIWIAYTVYASMAFM